MIFLISESLLYAALLILDALGLPSVWVKYLAIVLCFLTAVRHGVQTRRYFLAAAMALTLFADTFLLLLDRYYLIGVLAFCIVQTLYAVYLFPLAGRKSIPPRIGLFLLAVLILVLAGSADGLTVASAWSYTQLLVNVVCAFVGRKSRPGGTLFALGMLLFLLCDTCVGLYHITGYFAGSLFEEIAGAAGYLMWVFYLPSQVLITCSFCHKGKTP